jgi:hypothetical protein
VTSDNAGDEATPLYSPRQIYVASFLGTPAAAAWFISRNYRALSRAEKVREIALLGGVATIAAFIVAFLLPDRTPNVLWPLVYSIGIYYYAQHLFGSLYERHITGGGKRGSWWRVVGVALLISIALMSLLFLAYFMLSWVDL